MWDAAMWIVYGTCVGVFVLWCILPLREFHNLLAEHRKKAGRRE